MKYDYDVIIVGGSVAGAATAFWLGQTGLRVLVLDRTLFPRDKVCGEGIMPGGVRVLAEMGFLNEIRQLGAQPFHGITFYDHHGCSASATFPQSADRSGLCVRRQRLDAFLLAKAAALPAVEVRQGFRVRRLLQIEGRIYGVNGQPHEDPDRERSFTAPLTIGADGIHSIFHRLDGVRVRRPRHQRFGVRAHLQGVEGLNGQVEVIAGLRGEVYVAAHGEDMAMVALLLDRQWLRRFGGDQAALFWETLQIIRPFAERIEKSRLVSPIMATGPLGSRVTPAFGQGFLLIGDSAGALDPIAGEGMALSLRSAQVASEIIAAAFASQDFSPARLAPYGAARAAMIRPARRLTDWLLFLSRHKTLTHWTITMLNIRQEVLRRLLAVASGSCPLPP